ncbi:MAG TPA: hypothetical protein VFZ52_16160 [Chryseolinea sp.]
MSAAVSVVRIIFLLIFLGCNSIIFAQDTKQFVLPALTNVYDVPWRKHIYLFDEFQKGKITYTKGFELDYEFDLNYNIYFEKMDFIHSSGDTLSIMNTKEIRSIQVGNKTFFHDYNTGFYEVLVPLPLSLVFRNQFILEKVEFSNGMKRVHTGTDTRGVAINYGRIYKKEFFYFFVDRKNKLHKVTKANVLKLFPEQNTEVKDYLTAHSIDFESEEDLIALTNYCNKLADVSGESKAQKRSP